MNPPPPGRCYLLCASVATDRTIHDALLQCLSFMLVYSNHSSYYWNYGMCWSYTDSLLSTYANDGQYVCYFNGWIYSSWSVACVIVLRYNGRCREVRRKSNLFTNLPLYFNSCHANLCKMFNRTNSWVKKLQNFIVKIDNGLQNIEYFTAPKPYFCPW